MKFTDKLRAIAILNTRLRSMGVSIAQFASDVKQTAMLAASMSVREAANFVASTRGIGVGDIPGYAILLVVAAVTVGVGAKILGTSGMQAGEGDANVNTTLGRGVTALMKLSEWFDEIALVIAAVIIIGLIGGLFMTGGGGQRRGRR